MTTAAPSDVRTWAREQGLTSSARGPLPRAVLQAYAAAHEGSDTRRSAPAPRSGESVDARPALEERLHELEAQLATALARLAELEENRPRSLLGLNVTL